MGDMPLAEKVLWGVIAAGLLLYAATVVRSLMRM